MKIEIDPCFESIETFYEHLNKLGLKYEYVQPNINDPKIVIVERAYDSIDIGDYGVYLAWCICPISSDNSNHPLSKEEMNKLYICSGLGYQNIEMRDIPKNLSKFLNTFATRVYNYGIYYDKCDMDRRYGTWVNKDD